MARKLTVEERDKKTTDKKNFSNRLEEILNASKSYLSGAELALLLDTSRSTISAWRTDTNEQMPPVWKLKDIAQRLDPLVDWKVTMDWLLSDGVVDDLPSDDNPIWPPILRVPAKREFEDQTERIITSAKYTLCILVTTGTSIKYYGALVRKAMQKEGQLHVRVITSDPRHGCTVEMIRKRRVDLKPRTASVIGSITGTIGDFQHASETLKNESDDYDSRRLQIRSIPFLPGINMYLRDEDTLHGEAMVMLSNFQHSVMESPIATFTKTGHEGVFDYFRTQFERLWEFEPYPDEDYHGWADMYCHLMEVLNGS